MRSILDGKGFKLGIFSSNCSGGLAPTKVDERWSANWPDNIRMAQIADQTGIDFLLPIARWIGYGGETNFHGYVLETTTWATALLALTQNITIFSTVHTAFNHPMVVAKQLATMDQLSNGRSGINIVAGWNQPEYEALGHSLPIEHDERYAQAQEWWDVIKKAWETEGSYDFEGKFYKLKNTESQPKPHGGHIPVINAGSSKQGREFAAHNSDFSFTVVGGPEDGAEIVANIKSEAKEKYNRNIGVLTLGHVVCRPTRQEAEDYLHHYAEENADWQAVDNLMRLQGLTAQSFTPEMLASFRPRFAAGHGSCPLIGTPDEVAAEIKRFHDAGFAGMTVSFVDYAAELPYFAEEVLPRLERLGVRSSKKDIASVG